jgi:pyroglutamyl-peptidase
MILITGFQSYGGRSVNPAQAVADALDGTKISGALVCGRSLPVDFHTVRRQLPDLIDDLAPHVIISLGLWPGEPMIRLERVAANWSFFELPDNTGHRQIGAVIEGGPDAYLSKLPVDEMQTKIRAAGLPCRQSGSAGTYLCNATSYITMHHCAQHHKQTLAGFIHLPYLPEQVAQQLNQIADESVLEMHQRSDFASMSLEAMIEAVRVGLRTTVDRSQLLSGQGYRMKKSFAVASFTVS